MHSREVEQEPKCPSQDASLANASRRGQLAQGGHWRQVSSDFNPEETLAPRPQVASPCLGSNDHVSSTPTSQVHSLILTPRTQEDMETCNYVSTMPSARKPDPPSRHGRP